MQELNQLSSNTNVFNQSRSWMPIDKPRMHSLKTVHTTLIAHTLQAMHTTSTAPRAVHATTGPAWFLCTLLNVTIPNETRAMTKLMRMQKRDIYAQNGIPLTPPWTASITLILSLKHFWEKSIKNVGSKTYDACIISGSTQITSGWTRKSKPCCPILNHSLTIHCNSSIIYLRASERLPWICKNKRTTDLLFLSEPAPSDCRPN